MLFQWREYILTACWVGCLSLGGVTNNTLLYVVFGLTRAQGRSILNSVETNRLVKGHSEKENTPMSNRAFILGSTRTMNPGKFNHDPINVFNSGYARGTVTQHTIDRLAKGHEEKGRLLAYRSACVWNDLGKQAVATGKWIAARASSGDVQDLHRIASKIRLGQTGIFREAKFDAVVRDRVLWVKYLGL